MDYRRLPLTGLTNARELGGWNTPDGLTKYGVYLRTEVPAQITEEDKEFLREYGVTMDIDLRGSGELETMPDLLRDETWVEYVHLPMFNEHAARGSGMGKRSENEEFSWGKTYISMTEDCRTWVRDVIETIARADGVVMFHCATGKDRTGIVAAMLLGICGVDDADIIADYCVSEVYLEWIYDRLRGKFPDGRTGNTDPFFKTAPVNMRMLVKHWREKYGCVTNFLLECGVSESSIAKIRSRLLGK